MDEKPINAVEMTRKIRDGHAKSLAGKSHAERIAFFRERAHNMESKLPGLFAELVASGNRLHDQDMDTALRRIRERQAAYQNKK